MDGLPALTAWLGLHFGIGLVGTWLARRYALRRNLIDQPGARRSHRAATPRGGGVSIVAALLVALAMSAWLVPGHAVAFAAVGAGLSLVALVGWVDDHRPLSASARLCVHAVAAALLAVAVASLGGTIMAMLLAFVVALVLVNVWNFMDGIDGLAATQAILVALGCAAFAGGGAMSWLALALAAAGAGFLPFNFPRARIFLGDVGSGALGYAIAALLAGVALQTGAQGRPWLLLLLVSVFLVDASLTLAGRMLRRERWWEAHVQHAYQRWANGIGRHVPVTMAYGVATLALVLLSLSARQLPAPVTMVLVAGAWLAGGAVWYRLQGRYRLLTP